MTGKYDVIIIGAGIGGLVCGCYLAKAGLKVLIVEQHSKPGGYCTSFTRKDYSFDVAVHYLGGVSKGIISQIIDELDLRRSIEFLGNDPVIKIITKRHTILLYKEFRDTINYLKKEFPEEKLKIDSFFNFIYTKDFFHIYTNLKNLSFKNLLDKYINDDSLKEFFSCLVVASIGLTAKKVSAVTAVSLFRQYFSDFGYYPKGGAQNFTNQIMYNFVNNSGTILLSNKVKHIFLDDREQVDSVQTEDGERYYAKNIVSNIDGNETFQLLDINKKGCLKSETKELKPSVSFYSLFLGIKNGYTTENKLLDTLFIFDDVVQNHNTEDILNHRLKWLICCFSFYTSHKAIEAFTTAPFKSKFFWERNKESFSTAILEKIESNWPKITKFIDLKVSATPYTYYRYTNNYSGAAFGWASTKGQVKSNLCPSKTGIRGLYRAGHWTTVGTGQGGVTSVALSGRNAAQLICLDLNKKWKYSPIIL